MKQIHAKYASVLAAASGAHRKSARRSSEIADPLCPMDSVVRPATIAVSTVLWSLSFAKEASPSSATSIMDVTIPISNVRSSHLGPVMLADRSLVPFDD